MRYQWGRGPNVAFLFFPPWVPVFWPGDPIRARPIQKRAGKTRRWWATACMDSRFQLQKSQSFYFPDDPIYQCHVGAREWQSSLLSMGCGQQMVPASTVVQSFCCLLRRKTTAAAASSLFLRGLTSLGQKAPNGRKLFFQTLRHLYDFYPQVLLLRWTHRAVTGDLWRLQFRAMGHAQWRGGGMEEMRQKWLNPWWMFP